MNRKKSHVECLLVNILLKRIRKLFNSLPDIGVFCFAIFEETREDRTLVTAPEASVVLAFDDVIEGGPTCRECLNWTARTSCNNSGKGMLYFLHIYYLQWLNCTFDSALLSHVILLSR
jgi:hypothetical protein